MTVDELGRAVNLLRVELTMIAEQQNRLYKLISFIVKNQNELLEIDRFAPVIKSVPTGRESVN